MGFITVGDANCATCKYNEDVSINLSTFSSRKRCTSKRKTETDKANDRLFNGLEVKVVEVSSINFLFVSCKLQHLQGALKIKNSSHLRWTHNCLENHDVVIILIHFVSHSKINESSRILMSNNFLLHENFLTLPGIDIAFTKKSQNSCILKKNQHPPLFNNPSSSLPPHLLYFNFSKPFWGGIRPLTFTGYVSRVLAEHTTFAWCLVQCEKFLCAAKCPFVGFCEISVNSTGEVKPQFDLGRRKTLKAIDCHDDLSRRFLWRSWQWQSGLVAFYGLHHNNTRKSRNIFCGRYYEDTLSFFFHCYYYELYN